MWNKAGLGPTLALSVLVSVTGLKVAVAQQPLSAIDWLSDSVALPATVPVLPADEPPVSTGALVESITVRPLDAPSPDAVGLLPRSVSGLPTDLWGRSDPTHLATLLASFPTDTLPAVQELLFTILMAELNPPVSDDAPGTLFRARVDALLKRGAVEQAGALLERSGLRDAQSFRRSFDIALLTRQEDLGCARLRASPGVSASFPVRIFCLARTGDWAAAALTLRTAEALGQVSEIEDKIIARFLDPELFEGEARLPRPTPLTPLLFRMMAAVGEPVSTRTLPLAFAHADLHATVGWKTRVLATERLVRAGALPPNALLGVYLERKPSASGESWDRIKAVQTLQAALNAKDSQAITDALPRAYAMMRSADLSEAFAGLFASSFTDLDLPDPVQALAQRMVLLSGAAFEGLPVSPKNAFLKSIHSEMIILPEAPSPLMQAVADGFSATASTLPLSLSSALDAENTGEALLQALALVPRSADGDLSDLSSALTLLRQLDLHDAARAIATQLMIRERNT